ncbi:ATP-binding protein [Flavobacterium sp.]|uniref:ATP-binding protein n=1 Tax=Flavobacterium sp. TaxID=239 RepID=UPI003A8E4B76
MEQKFTFKINRNTTCFNVIDFLANIDKNKSLELTIDIDCIGFINSENYVIISSYINEMKENGIDVAIIVNKKNCNTLNYASRIDFFKSLGVDFEENFRRHDTSGNLIPITKIDPNVYDISQDILDVFKNDFKLEDADIDQLSFIMGEMVCNATIHSKSKSGAYLYCQKYKQIDELEFILIDSGIGVKESLIKNEKFVSLSNQEALIKALEYEVTNGEGRGHGLFFASEFVRRNNGSMVLISGENHLVINNETITTGTNSYWNGVFLKFKFKFDPKISIYDLMDEANYELTN